MKKTLITAIFAMVFVSMLCVTQVGHAAIVGTQPIRGGLLNVELAKYEPFPADAGEFVTVWIDVNNRGIESVTNATFILEPKYPFSLPDNDAKRQYTRITGLDDVRLEYRLLVDKDAPNSTSEVLVKYGENGETTSEKTISIRVKEGETKDKADLKALFVETSPAAYPGGTAILTIDLVNADDGTAYHTIAMADTEIAEIVRNTIFVGDLEADDFDSVDFSLKIKQDVAAGEYPVNITSIYKDEDSNELQQSSIVYITVITAEEAITKQVPEVPTWMVLVYIIVLIIILRAVLLPFVRWFVKPFRKKKKR